MEFKYTILENEEMAENMCLGREPSGSEAIKIQRDERGHFLIQANQDGWLYLAKICVEMSYFAEKDPEYHTHRTSQFEFSEDEVTDAVGFHVIDELSASEIIRAREKGS